MEKMKTAGTITIKWTGARMYVLATTAIATRFILGILELRSSSGSKGSRTDDAAEGYDSLPFSPHTACPHSHSTFSGDHVHLQVK